MLGARADQPNRLTAGHCRLRDIRPLETMQERCPGAGRQSSYCTCGPVGCPDDAGKDENTRNRADAGLGGIDATRPQQCVSSAERRGRIHESEHLRPVFRHVSAIPPMRALAGRFGANGGQGRTHPVRSAYRPRRPQSIAMATLSAGSRRLEPVRLLREDIRTSVRAACETLSRSTADGLRMVRAAKTLWRHDLLIAALVARGHLIDLTGGDTPTS